MSKTLPFTGSGVAIITPFDGLKTNYDELGKLIEYHIENNTDAIIICGTTGEASTMPDEEHLAAIKYTVEKAAYCSLYGYCQCNQNPCYPLQRSVQNRYERCYRHSKGTCKG